MSVKVRYSSVDRFSKTGTFKTLKGAQKFAQKWVGETPEISWTFHYAVSSFGTGKVTVEGELDGKAVTIFDLFPKCEKPGSSTAEPVDEPAWRTATRRYLERVDDQVAAVENAADSDSKETV